MRFLGIGSIAAIVGVAGVGAASTLRGSGEEKTVTTSGGNVAAPETRAAAKKSVPPARAAAPVQQQAAPPRVEVPVSTPAPAPSRPASGGGFVLVDGKTQLTDSIYAVRAGDSVTVNFDAYGYRTRRSAKLEQSLRLTLPMIFGKMATASIDTVGAGAFVTNRDVIGSLAGEGMRLTLDNGAAVRIRVLTRVVTDGPIAIGYLATIIR